MFATPKRHIFAQNREFWRIFRQNSSRGLGCSELQEPPPPKKKKTNTFWVCNLARKITHARKGNLSANRDELLHRCRGPRHNHLCQFLWFPRTGFERGGGGCQILGFSIDLHRRSYNTLALLCECVITFALYSVKPQCATVLSQRLYLVLKDSFGQS